jgi:uroporphyrinogen decarboxylase
MNARERFLKIMSFEKPDRCLLWEMGYWVEVLERWYSEGLERKKGLPWALVPGDGLRGEGVPHNTFSTTRFRESDVHDRLGLDAGIVCLPINSSPNPPFERVVFEETDDFRVYQDEYGIRKRINKREASIPEFLDWQVKDRRDFERLKEERFRPGLPPRVPLEWPQLLEGYRKRGYPLSIGGGPIGFYGFLRYMMGEERLLTNFYYDPELVRDMMRFLVDFWIELWEEALSQVDIDCAHFWEDMAYRNGPLISPAMFREFMMPCYQRITGFLKSRGVQVILVDCDGNLDELTPLFLEAGLTGIYPIEIQAGNDPVAMRRKYPRMHILGGVNKLELAKGRPAIDRELEKVPALIASGGYIPFVDHLVHPEISWENFFYYRSRIREMAGAW